jgi:hypothetical protein
LGSVINVIIEGIKALIGNNPIGVILYLSTLFLFIWLYKEFRKTSLDIEQDNRARINSHMVTLLDLEFELIKFLEDKTNKDTLIEKLKAAYPIMTIELSKKVSKFSSKVDNQFIKEFISEIRSERNGMKERQNDSLIYINEKSLMRHLEYHFHSKFKSLLTPIMMTCLALFLIILFLLLTLAISSEQTIIEKIHLILTTMNSIVFITFLLGIFDAIIGKRVINRPLSWIYIILFFIFSFLSFAYSSECNILSTILFVFYIITPYFVLKRIIKKRVSK